MKGLPPVPSHPRLLAVLSALLFSIASPVTKMVEMPTLSVTFFRSLVGLGALVALTPRDRRRDLMNFNGIDFLCGAAYAVTSLSFFLALRQTTAANATILFQTTPVFLIPLGALFLTEKADRWDITAIILMIGGIALCFRESLGSFGQLGDLLALNGALFFAFMNIMLRKNNPTGNIRSLIAGNIIIVMAALPFQFGLETPFRPGDVIAASSLGVVHMALPFLIYTRALIAIPAIEGTIFKSLEAVLAPLWVALLVGEMPGWWTAAGFISVMAATVLRARKPRETAHYKAKTRYDGMPYPDSHKKNP